MRRVTRVSRYFQQRWSMLLLLVCAVVLGLGRADGAAEEPEPLRLSLEATSLEKLQAHSGQRVRISGYFRRESEVSTLFPTRASAEDFDMSGAVWADLGEKGKKRFWDMPFRGHLTISGILKAEPGGGYGHMGGAKAKLADARIEGWLPREIVGFFIMPAAIAGGILFFRIRRQRAGSKR